MNQGGQLLNTSRCQAQGETFEIDLLAEADAFAVYCYLLQGGSRVPVNSRYAASYEVHYSYFEQHGERIQDHLIAVAKSDLESGTYFRAPPGERHLPARIAVNPLTRP